MAVFYQKYRPQKFADVVGQEPIVQTLRNAADSGQLAHAYLFTGSRGVGKTTLARLLAKAANCPNLKDGDPCGKCDVCNAIANGTSLDIIEIDAASHTGVDNVREFIEHAQFRPTSMARKVFIIDEVHMLSKAAFNALLKTLEEPPEHVMFILATTDIEKVPATIASRTQRFDFKRIPPVQMAKALQDIADDQKLKLRADVIEAVIAQSEGSMRDALTRLDMVASLGKKINIDDVERLLGVTPRATIQKLVSLIAARDAASMPDFFENCFASGIDPMVFNRSVLVYLRQLLNAKLTGTTEATLKDDETFQSQLSSLALNQMLFIIRLFLRSYKELSFAPSPELPLLLASIEASLQGSAGSAVAAPAAQPQAQVQPQTHATTKVQTEKPDNVVESTVEAVVEPVSAPAVETPEAPIDTEITMEEVGKWWPEVINKIKVENSPIATLLKNSPLIDVEDGRVTVAVKYLFHKENLDSKKNIQLITDTITAVCGKRLGFKSVIKNHTLQPITETVDALSDALKVFGGELIE